jgi:aminopeptidase N
LAPLDRAAITADTYALARRGAVPAADYLALLALPAPRTPSEWLVIMDSLDWLDEALESTPAQAAFRAWGRTQLAPQLEALGWTDAPGDSLPVLRLRGALVDVLGRFDHAPTIAKARRLQTDGGASQSTITAVANTVARHADEPAFDALRAARKAATGQEERHRLERALTLLRDPALVARAQAIALTDEWEPGAASYFATHVGREGGNAALAFAFVEKHYATLAAKTSDGGRLHLLPNAAGGFNDRASIDTLMAAQQARVGEAGLVPARRVAEQIREKAEMREREGQRLAAQLRTSEKRSER